MVNGMNRVEVITKMAMRGTARKVAKPLIGYKDIDARTTYAPLQVDLRNGYMDVVGNWNKRNGYASKFDTTRDLPVELLIPEGNGFAVLEDGSIYNNVITGIAEMPELKLTGASRPVYRKFDDKIMIVDGGLPTQIVGNVISRLDNVPVNTRFIGRVGSYTLYAGYDDTEFTWSAVNNPENITDGGITNIKKDGTIQYATDFANRWFVFKEKSIEVWGQRGGDTPFVLLDNLSIWEKTGTKAPYSVVKANGQLHWFDTDGDFKSWPGKVLSKPYRSYLDDKIQNPEDCYGFDCRKENCIRWFFPKDGITIVYDYLLKLLYEDNKWSGSGFQLLPWNSYMEFDKIQYFGDYANTGLIHEWDKKHEDDNGDPIRVFREFKIQLSATGKLASVNKVQFTLKRGVATDSVDSPTFTYRYRFDESSRWVESTIDLGVKGDYNPYVEITQLGQGREMTWQIIETDAVDFILNEMEITARALGR